MAKAGVMKGSSSRVTTLKRRTEFQRVRKGARHATPAFVLEARARGGELPGPSSDEPRFGFTITRQVGKAVERNRMRRRLKAAVGGVAAHHARSGFDYVLIARRPALTAAFSTLVADLARALERVHRAPPRGR